MLDEAKRILKDLIAFPTVSADSNLEMIGYMVEHLDACKAIASMNARTYDRSIAGAL